MKQRATSVSTATITAATARAKETLRQHIQTSNDILDDVGKTRRLERHQCRCCFYFQRIAGAAATERDCGLCGEPQQYGSTNTDVLCLQCAKEQDLCKRCGGKL